MGPLKPRSGLGSRRRASRSPRMHYFAAIDLERESLLGGLLRHRVSVDEPTFFSWLGVTMYLKEDAIDAVLSSIAAFPAGTR